MGEQWKGVPGMEDKYEASTCGRIRNIQTGRVLTFGTNPDGYRRVALVYEGRNRGTLAHVIIARAFHGPRPTGYHTRHLDGDKENNRPNNLAYGTVLENAMDSYLHGVRKNPPLTARKRRVIACLLRKGLPQVVIARRVGLPAQCICRENKRLLREARVSTL